jgi:tetratricopeptide (TPR) repeat protein
LATLIAASLAAAQTPNQDKDRDEPPVEGRYGPDDGPRYLDMPEGYGPAVPDPRIPRRQPMYRGEPAEGPLDPGPYPEMPGYFTDKAIAINSSLGGAIGGHLGALGGVSLGGLGNSPGYFPGVYPYYDAQFHYRWYLAYKKERKVHDYADENREAGRDSFYDEHFERAALRFLGAAEADHTDAASRVHGGHALFALGRYDEAHVLLKRAFELAPQLTYGQFDPRDDYARYDLFDRHMATLRGWVRERPSDASARVLLGYMEFFTAGPTAALPGLREAVRISPEDSLAERLLRAASRASFHPDAIGGSAQDRRPYDKMRIQPDERVPYDAMPEYRGSGDRDSNRTANGKARAHRT